MPFEIPQEIRHCLQLEAGTSASGHTRCMGPASPRFPSGFTPVTGRVLGTQHFPETTFRCQSQPRGPRVPRRAAVPEPPVESTLPRTRDHTPPVQGLDVNLEIYQGTINEAASRHVSATWLDPTPPSGVQLFTLGQALDTGRVAGWPSYPLSRHHFGRENNDPHAEQRTVGDRVG